MRESPESLLESAIYRRDGGLVKKLCAKHPSIAKSDYLPASGMSRQSWVCSAYSDGGPQILRDIIAAGFNIDAPNLPEVNSVLALVVITVI
jgi:hypothetical protein